MKSILKLRNINLFIFILISTVIFITAGNFIEDYKRLIILKLVIISLISFKINFFKEIKILISKNKSISTILILFIISITISFIFSPSTIDQFAFIWLRIRYLDTLTDIFLFIALYLNFKDENINYKILINSIIIPGLIFSIFVIYTFISNQGLSDTNKDIIFFDGRRMVGMLITFLIIFYLGCLHSTFKQKNFQNIFILTIFMTLAILLMGRGTLVAISATYLFMCIILFNNKKNFRNEFLVFIFSILISIVISQIIFNVILNNQNIDFIVSNKERDSFFYTTDRLGLWKYGFILFSENLFFGKGPGGFAISAYNDFYAQKSYGDLLINDNFTHNHPHNFIIQFLVEWGVVGTFLICILLIKLSINSLRFFFTYKNYQLLISGLSIVGLASHGLVDGALYHATFTFYFIICLSILCSELSRKIK